MNTLSLGNKIVAPILARNDLSERKRQRLVDLAHAWPTSNWTGLDISNELYARVESPPEAEPWDRLVEGACAALDAGLSIQKTADLLRYPVLYGAEGLNDFLYPRGIPTWMEVAITFQTAEEWRSARTIWTGPSPLTEFKRYDPSIPVGHEVPTTKYPALRFHVRNATGKTGGPPNELWAYTWCIHYQDIGPGDPAPTDEWGDPEWPAVVRAIASAILVRK